MWKTNKAGSNWLPQVIRVVEDRLGPTRMPLRTWGSEFNNVIYNACQNPAARFQDRSAISLADCSKSSGAGDADAELSWSNTVRGVAAFR
jgi:hypothetical protein